VTLRARLATGASLLLAVAVGSAFVAAYYVARSQLDGGIDNSLRQRAAVFAAAGRGASTRSLGKLPRRIAKPRFGTFTDYTEFVSSNGKVVLPPGEKARLPVGDAARVASGSRGAYFSDVVVGGTHVRVYTAPLRKGVAIEITRSMAEVDHVLARLRLLFVAISLLAVLGAAALGILLSRAALRPVRRLTEHAERIAATGDLGERTDEGRSDELGRLAVAFNTMLDALSSSLRSQRQLVADASHELRTPLAVARANLDVIELHEEMPAAERRRALAEASEELKEMTHLIEELVDLARGDAQPLAMRSVRLDRIVADAIAVARRRSGRTYELDAVPTVVEGSTEALARAVANLLDNAAKWSPADAPIAVTVAHGTVSVCDRGPGVRPEDALRVFDRFYRAAEARTMPGSGLGLAIVRQTAEAHGGTVAVDTPVGGGSRFTLRLPTTQT
jgi:two-component system sensor histidine kinase MprB